MLRGNVGTDISKRQFYLNGNETEEALEARKAKRFASRRANKEYDLYNLPAGSWSLYDLRRTAATRLMELTGCDWEVVQRILAHAEPNAATTGLYSRFARWPDRCAALDLLGKVLMQCTRGEALSLTSDNVRQLKRA